MARSKSATTMISSVRKMARTRALRSTCRTPSSAMIAPPMRHHQYQSSVMPSLSAMNPPVAAPKSP